MKSKTHLMMILAVILLALASSWILIGCSDSTEPEPEPTTGTVMVSSEPSYITITWHLAGPGAYNYDGSNDETLPNLATGDYTITWNATDGYVTPIAQTLSLTTDGTIYFGATYAPETGTVTVSPAPDYINVTWALDGPGSFDLNSQNEVTYPGVPVGDYTITWNENTPWITPPPETLALTHGDSITFTATYIQPVYSILVTKEPVDLSVIWHIDGPNSYSAGGSGEGEYLALTTIYLTDGDYTMTWSDVAGWVTPAPETKTLTADVKMQFHGIYVPE